MPKAATAANGNSVMIGSPNSNPFKSVFCRSSKAQLHNQYEKHKIPDNEKLFVENSYILQKAILSRALCQALSTPTGISYVSKA